MASNHQTGSGNDQFHWLDQELVTIEDFDCSGRILDIGGGGEGVIGRLKGSQVVAVDPDREELEEAAPGPLKIVMDGTDLKFLNASFELATAFFSLMYIDKSSQLKVLTEVYRVLQPGGRFLVWDLTIPRWTEPNRDVIVVPLLVQLPGEQIETGYGQPWQGKEQDLAYYLDLARNAGFDLEQREESGSIFHLKLKKPD